jgi:2-iminoacetate synthase
MKSNMLLNKKWADERIKKEEIEKYLFSGNSFIDEGLIREKLAGNQKPDSRRIKDILEKSLKIETLTLDETAALLNVEDSQTLELMKEAALKVKKKVYDNRIVTFAPLYLGNFCVNDCLYCGFRRSNKLAQRRRLNLEALRREIKVLAGLIGHKRLIVVYGEHPLNDITYMLETIKEIYRVKEKTRKGFGQIRRVNVNAPPLQLEELRQLKTVGIGTYQVFQETYHRPTYEKVHPAGTPKHDYLWRLYTMHRALKAGIDDVGLGALFGLYDWKFEVMGLIAHNRELEEKFGIGAHTISFPRLEPAENTPYTEHPEHEVSDAELKRLMLVIRLAVPHTGMIITAREEAPLRRESLFLGITQTDASSRIGIGSYQEKESSKQKGNCQQFLLGDTRSLEELICEFAQMGFITSFCTAGYRCGRTGKCIMDLLRSGEEGKFCKLNAVLTFREWLDDFASEEAKTLAERVIDSEIKEIQTLMPRIFPRFMKYYERIKKGERDLYF